MRAVAITSLIVLALGGSESAVAQGNSGRAEHDSSGGAGAEGVKEQVTGRAKGNTKSSPDLERTNSLDRDSPVLRLLWLLTGSSRR